MLDATRGDSAPARRLPCPAGTVAGTGPDGVGPAGPAAATAPPGPAIALTRHDTVQRRFAPNEAAVPPNRWTDLSHRWWACKPTR
jgi:hypothetical protein